MTSTTLSTPLPGATSAHEYASFLNKMLTAFFEHTGVESSMAVLLGFLQEYTPATYITVTMANFKQDTLKTCYEYDINRQFTGTPFLEGGHLHAMLPFLVEELLPVRIALIHDVLEEKRFADGFLKMDQVHKSLLVLELFAVEDHTYFLSLRAKERGAFTMEHARILRYLHVPMTQLIRKTFIQSENLNTIKINAVVERENAGQMLIMCKGLASICKEIDGVAPTRATTLILGETGVGKELAAAAIHEKSRRCGGPFVKVNCGAIPESLLEAELFGYEKGAFTGAIAAHKGFFEQADGGTLYLDEVGELTPSAQVKLLRVLETREIQRIGSAKRIMVDFRLLVATNRHLEDMVKNGGFRADLWYRLNAFSLRIPPLRQRREDISTLARFFLYSCAKDMEIEDCPEIEEKMLQRIMMRDWPGNTRELRNWIESCLIHTRMANSPVLLEPATPRSAAPDRQVRDLFLQEADFLTLHAMDKKYIEHALQKCNGKIQGKNSAAELLGLKGTTLRAKMRKLAITQP